MNMNGISFSTSSSFFDTYFGAGSSKQSASSGVSSLLSQTSSLGDWRMINSGAYKKALKAYYAINDDSKKNSISGSGSTDSQINLSTLKSSAKRLNETAKDLQKMDFSSGVTDKALEKAKEFVSNYNETLNTTKNMNSYSILQTEVWMTENAGARESMLKDVGISIKEDNTLSIDEEAFKKADAKKLSILFNGSDSFAAKVSGKASTLFNQSANQLAANQGRTLYTVDGAFN